eukprot:1115262-Rhodomonas_salina.2
MPGTDTGCPYAISGTDIRVPALAAGPGLGRVGGAKTHFTGVYAVCLAGTESVYGATRARGPQPPTSDRPRPRSRDLAPEIEHKNPEIEH